MCFAYKKAQIYFEQYYERCYFLPQSMDVSFFHEYNTAKKRLFMQMGRRTEILHSLVLSYLKENNLKDIMDNYVYEREKGKIIYPQTTELAEEISKTYFFIVAPQNVENKKITGNISEVTARFYEAMACKSLLVGIKPIDSFDELFPYEDAMIEVNEKNFSNRIDELIKNKRKYYELVEKNYEYVMQNHRWKNRYNFLIDMLNLQD